MIREPVSDTAPVKQIAIVSDDFGNGMAGQKVWEICFNLHTIM
jgi:hypothetical protein